MARYDKFEPQANGFRADIAADYPDANLGKLYGVGLDSTGKLVQGSGVDGIVGVLVVNQKPGRVGPLKEITRVDVMVHGCVTDFGPSSAGLVPGTDFGTAGKKYYSDVTGIITSTPGPGSVLVGVTNEPDRLEVNVIPTALVAGQAGIATPSARANSTAYTVGTYVTQSGTTQVCTTAGTSASSAPTAPASVGGTVTDGTAVFTRVL